MLGPFLFLGFLVVGMAVFVIALVLVVRVLLAPRAVGGRPDFFRPRASTWITDDGFWVGGNGCPPASVIHYHYWSGGVRNLGSIPFQPGPDGRQFVYTGLRPDQVAIASVVPPGDAPDMPPAFLDGSQASPPPLAQHHFDTRASHSPSAY